MYRIKSSAKDAHTHKVDLRLDEWLSVPAGRPGTGLLVAVQ